MKTKKQWWLVIGIICINILIVGFSAAIAAEAPNGTSYGRAP